MNKKHSFSDRLKYMRLLEEGYSINYVSTKYGIGSKLLTCLWIQYQQKGSEALHKKKNIRANGDLKRIIVCDIENNHLSLVEASLKYGASTDRISVWLRIARTEGLNALDITKKRGRAKGMGRPKKKAPQRELEKLREENLKLRIENELLKKVRALVEEKEKSVELLLIYLIATSKAEKPYQKWATDVTEFKIDGRKAYLSPIIDMFNGEIISYTISDRPDLKMVMDMLKKAQSKVNITEELILHSDQGWHYQHKQYQMTLKHNGIIQSMSRKGNCLDNAVMENFFGIMKSELLYLQHFKNIFEFKFALHEYIEYYNNKRIKLRLKG